MLTAHVDSVNELVADGTVDALERVLCCVGYGLLECDGGGEGCARGGCGHCSGDLEGHDPAGGGFCEERHFGWWFVCVSGWWCKWIFVFFVL